jgi:ferredoxin-fold anticodon binding domain-containing protein
MIGKQVIIRTYTAGVHFGTLASINGKEAVLTDARRLWYWEGAFTLSAVAMKGVNKTSKLSVSVPQILLTEAIEVIPCSDTAIECLRALVPYEPK